MFVLILNFFTIDSILDIDERFARLEAQVADLTEIHNFDSMVSEPDRPGSDSITSEPDPLGSEPMVISNDDNEGPLDFPSYVAGTASTPSDNLGDIRMELPVSEVPVTPT